MAALNGPKGPLTALPRWAFLKSGQGLDWPIWAFPETLYPPQCCSKALCALVHLLFRSLVRIRFPTLVRTYSPALVRLLCGHVRLFPRYPCSARLYLPLSQICCRRCMSGCWIGLRWVLLSLFCSTRSMLGGTMCAVLGGSLGGPGCMVSLRLRVGIGIVLAGVCPSGPILGGVSCPFP